ncbi:ABC transporter permease [Streptomyces phaeofaciens]|jgi:ABC-type multidrug transport system permease subunit|uniref:ABC transporter permease n=1 Tax=Streptomyces phaeofaciens TaxID=68254 RepID=UPI0036B0E2A6
MSHRDSAGMRLTHRLLMAALRSPGDLLPSLIFPALILFSWIGAYGRLPEVPGFPAGSALQWLLPFGILQASAFAAFPVSLAMARDLQHGFARRLLVAPIPRRQLLTGPFLAAGCRAVVTAVLLLSVGLAFGCRVEGGAPGVAVVFLGAVAVTLIATELGLTVALVFRSQRAAPLILIGVFLLMFLTPAQVPQEYLTGWSRTVAEHNPMTFVVDAVRGAVAGRLTADTLIDAGLAATGLAGVLGVLLAAALRRAS